MTTPIQTSIPTTIPISTPSDTARSDRSARRSNRCVKRRTKRRPSPRASVLSAILSAGLLGASAPASADFLQDFYENAGAQGAHTAPGVFESQGLGVVTGGSFVMKVPRKSFQPVSFDAPHLKAGCGGIDVFLGAFSIPSRDEFVSFLRGIGSALPGLAYQLALAYLSPDLEQQVSEFRDMIMKYTQFSMDSCEAAQSIIDGGVSLWQDHLGTTAANNLRNTGEADDQSDAERLVRTNGEKRLSAVPETTDAEGNILSAPELNFTWALLKAGKWGKSMDRETLETVMTLLGTVIYTKTGSGENQTLRANPIGGRDILDDLYGGVDEPVNPNAKRLQCDEETRCLHPTEVEGNSVNLVNAVYKAALKYRDSIRSRNRGGVTNEEIALLANVSSIPLPALIATAASPRMAVLSDELLRLYAEAAAYEGITTALSALASDIERVLASSSAREATSRHRVHAEALEARLRELRRELLSRQAVLAASMSRARDYALQVEHIEKSVYGAEALKAASDLPFLQFNGSAR